MERLWSTVLQYNNMMVPPMYRHYLPMASAAMASNPTICYGIGALALLGMTKRVLKRRRETDESETQLVSYHGPTESRTRKRARPALILDGEQDDTEKSGGHEDGLSVHTEFASPELTAIPHIAAIPRQNLDEKNDEVLEDGKDAAHDESDTLSVPCDSKSVSSYSTNCAEQSFGEDQFDSSVEDESYSESRSGSGSESESESGFGSGSESESESGSGSGSGSACFESDSNDESSNDEEESESLKNKRSSDAGLDSSGNVEKYQGKGNVTNIAIDDASEHDAIFSPGPKESHQSGHSSESESESEIEYDFDAKVSKTTHKKSNVVDILDEDSESEINNDFDTKVSLKPLDKEGGESPATQNIEVISCFSTDS